MLKWEISNNKIIRNEISLHINLLGVIKMKWNILGVTENLKKTWRKKEGRENTRIFLRQKFNSSKVKQPKKNSKDDNINYNYKLIRTL